MLESASRGGWCAWSGGVPGLGAVAGLGGVAGLGVPGPGGCVACPGGGVAGPGGVLSQHALRQTPPVNRMIDRQFKNITLATTSLRPVITKEITTCKGRSFI